MGYADDSILIAVVPSPDVLVTVVTVILILYNLSILKIHLQ